MLRLITILLVALAGLIVLGLLMRTAQPEGSAPEPHRLSVFTAIPYWDQKRAVEQFEKHIDVFDAVSLFWYLLDENGAIRTYSSAVEDRSIISFAHQHGVKVLALVANLPEDGDWDKERVQKVIASPEARSAHIASLLALTEAYGFDGINIDYEFLDDSQRADFTAFINELGAALHARGKLLAVAIHAQTPGSETRGQDLPSLTGADILVFMTYDEHWETSVPGPMASLPWMKETIAYAKRMGVPRQHIWLGVPLDAYDWPQADTEIGWGSADGLQYREAIALAEFHDAQVDFDDVAKAPHFSYADRDNVYREVWFENVDSFIPKYELAKEAKLGGVALWRLGREDERIYEIVRAERTRQ